MFHRSSLAQCLVAGAVFTCHAQAQVPRVLSQGTLPSDTRLQPLKDLDGYFPFAPAPSRAAWDQRSQQLRRQVQVALGLWPMPAAAPLQPVIHGRIEREDYSVERVYFESYPGFFVTGNLYRPKGRTSKVPGVLCPHGHWDQGRFMDDGPDKVKREIAQGAERFEEGGRSPLQARCVQLARMGCVVFHWDMAGYADSQQLPMELVHGFKKQRPEMATLENWGFFSPQAEAHLQSVMGLQTYNAIRALDFLESLPEVDAKRLAVTGASGGGTQTFVLAALDPRPALIFPAVMVSTAMQGGCTCENASLLRVHTGNVELAALFAPKPMGLTAADDWTREMSTKGFPELKAHYAMMGAPKAVQLKPLVHFQHNYNAVSRVAFYDFLNQHFHLGQSEPVLEKDYKRLSRQEMSVWDSTHPAPPGGPDFERTLLRTLTVAQQNQLSEAQTSPSQFRALAGPAWEVLLDEPGTGPRSIEFSLKSKESRDEMLVMTGLIREGAQGRELPAVFLHPKSWNGKTVLWIDEAGKSGLFETDGKPRPEIVRLVAAGASVVGVDLLHQGEFLADGKPLTRTPRVKNPREAAAYTWGYNPTLFASRVQDIRTVLYYIRNHERRSSSVDLAGFGKAGPLVAAARALSGEAVSAAAIGTGGFRFGKLLDQQDPLFVPGGARYGDLPGLLALGAPGRLWITDEGELPDPLLKTLYGGAETNLVMAREGSREKAAAWLLGQ